ncbi:hypothetical protein EKG38_13955 [Shewanella canadensis]|uniref:Uncharacterized protein n=1 Tax=Shewanella canadensis TaxID=271096 RepID=A0A3S0J5Y4_9GAMM|nr:hypothetical protein [Shewanella canadensis]RTR38603.1 hypothetical protein EKG38_13955 [Shewanella canadensis]
MKTINPIAITTSLEGESFLPFFLDCSPAEVKLDEQIAQRYLDSYLPGAAITTSVRSKHLWEGQLGPDYFVLYQSSASLIAIHVTQSMEVNFVCHSEFWNTEHWDWSEPLECLTDFHFQLTDLNDWNLNTASQMRQSAINALEWWQVEVERKSIDIKLGDLEISPCDNGFFHYPQLH